MSQDYTAAYIIKKVNIAHDKDIKMLKDTSLDTIYSCSYVTESTGFTLLMKLILLEKKYASEYSLPYTEKAILLRGIIKKYIMLHPEEANEVNEKGWTPLMLTIPNVETCNIKFIKLLLKHTNVNATNSGNITVLALVIKYNPINCEKLVKILLNRGADIDIANIEGWTPLMLAIENNNIPVINLLLEHNANINMINSDGWNPLILACGYLYNVDIIRSLLERGANVNIVSKNGLTPLMIAIEKRNPLIIKLLLEHNANVNAVSKKGWTALMFSCKRFENTLTDIVKLLLEHNANVNIVNKDGDTALIIALNNNIIIEDDYNLLKPLFEYDAYIKECDGYLIPFSTRRELVDSKKCEKALRKVYNSVTILNIKN